MKRLALLAALSVIGGQALAADLSPPYAPPPRAPDVYFPVARLYSWTGFYVGGNAGAGWNNASFSDSASSSFSTSNTTTTFLGGAQFGANYQFGRLVLGTPPREHCVCATDDRPSAESWPLLPNSYRVGGTTRLN